MNLIFALHLAATLYMTGVIWTVQLVHYPMLGFTRDAFDDCQRLHLARMGIVVAPAMLMEAGTGVIIAWRYFGDSLVLLASALLAVIWLSTFLIQVPRHGQLARGFDRRVHAQLVSTNWIRTAAWTLRSACLLILVQRHGF